MVTGYKSLTLQPMEGGGGCCTLIPIFLLRISLLKGGGAHIDASNNLPNMIRINETSTTVKAFTRSKEHFRSVCLY